jgi:hypothetical protein
MKGNLRAAFDRTAHLLPLHPALFAQHLAAFEAIRDERYQNLLLYPATSMGFRRARSSSCSRSAKPSPSSRSSSPRPT